jgi:CrcB protein
MNTLWIGLGGAAGSIARFHFGQVAMRRWGSAFPYGTLGVNVVGSLLLALLMTIALRTDWVSPTVRLALASGVLGGFTTYSSFNYETIALVQGGAWGRAALYVLATVAGCLAAGAAGWAIGRAITGSGT